ncbi:MAG: hypothetical protein EXR45_04820 [Chloroflexi bacterium]|nr:hypothetical protein [Chloroflexota bacterium]
MTPQSLGVLLLIIAVGAVPGLYVPESLSAYEPPKTHFVIFVAVLAVCLSVVDRGGVWRRPVHRYSLSSVTGSMARSVGIGAGLLFVCVVVVSSFGSIAPGTSLSGTLNRGQGTAFIVVLTAALTLNRANLGVSCAREWIMRALALGSVAPMVVAVAQALGVDPVVGRVFPGDRPPGTIGNAVSLGTYLAVVAVLSAGLAIRAWAANQPRSGGQPEPSNRSPLDEMTPYGSEAEPAASSVIGAGDGLVRAVSGVLGAACIIGGDASGRLFPGASWLAFPCAFVGGLLIALASVPPAAARVRASEVAVWGTIAAVATVATAVSGSRMALVGAVLAMLLLGVLSSYQLGLRSRVDIGQAVLGLLGGALLLGMAGMVGGPALRALWAGALPVVAVRAGAEAVVTMAGRDSLTPRLEVWDRAIGAYLHGVPVNDAAERDRAASTVGMQYSDARRPLPGTPGPTDRIWRVVFGYGPDSQPFILGLDAQGATFDRAHSGLLDLLITTGVAGLVSFIVCISAACAATWRRDANGERWHAVILIPVMVTIGLSSLTGVDSTVQAVVTAVVLGMMLATPNQPEPPPVYDLDASVPVANLAVLPVFAAVVVVLSGMVGIAGGATSGSPWSWGVGSAVASAMVIVCVSWRHLTTRGLVVVAVAAFLACACVVPAWVSLAAGIRAGDGGSYGVPSSIRTRGEQAADIDPGQATYRMMRGH